MSSCSNSSNLLGNVNISDISNSGARLLMTHPISGFSGGISVAIGEDGVTAGDVIRYDVIPGSPSENKYTKAQADVAQHAEMVGVIENISGNSPNEVVSVVLSGQIQFPASRFVDADHVATPTVAGASGGNDVYFLSEATAGVLQNLAPNEVGTIAKPILQVMSDNGIFNAQVVNYIGYQIGGSITVEDKNDDRTGTVADVVDFANKGTKLVFPFDSQWFPLHKEDQWLALDKSAKEFTQWTYNDACEGVFANGKFGLKVRLEFTTTPPSNWPGTKLTQKDADGRILSTWIVDTVDRPNNTAIIFGVNVDQSTNLAIDVDTTKKIYSGLSAYTLNGTNSVTRLSFRLPVETSTARTTFKDMNGNLTSYPKVTSMFIGPDGGLRGASIAQDVTVKNLTATDKITITSYENDITATDVAYILKQMNDEIEELKGKLNLVKTQVDIA